MSDLQPQYEFQHYYFLATPVDCVNTDNLFNQDFGHGKLVRFNHSFGRAIALTIKGKSVVIFENRKNATYTIICPAGKESSFRIFKIDGSSFYNGDVLENHDVSKIMQQVSYYI